MLDFFDFIYQWFSQGIFDVVDQIIVFWAKKFTIWSFEMAIYSIDVSWRVGKELLTDLNISATLNSYWSNLPPETSQFLAFFNIPEVINIILSAGAAKIVMRAVPGL